MGSRSDIRNLLTPIFKGAFLVAAIGAALLIFNQQKAQILSALAGISNSHLSAAALFSLFHVGTAFAVWKTILKADATAVAWHGAARIFFLSQMGKYLPGGIWTFVAGGEFGREAGLTRSTTIASFMLALYLSILAGAALAVATVPQYRSDIPGILVGLLAAAVALSLLFVTSVRRWMAGKLKLQIVDPIRLIIAFAFSVVVWCFAGAQLYALTHAIGIALPLSNFWLFSGFYALAWIAGFLVVIAPAGLGAREATLIMLLTTVMSLPEASVVALLSRILVTIADLVAAALVLAIGDRKAEQ